MPITGHTGAEWNCGFAGSRRLHCIVLKVLEDTFRAREYLTGHRGGVAQLGEHLLCKQGVIGSNPFTSTRVKDLGS